MNAESTRPTRSTEKRVLPPFSEPSRVLLSVRKLVLGLRQGVLIGGVVGLEFDGPLGVR